MYIDEYCMGCIFMYICITNWEGSWLDVPLKLLTGSSPKNWCGGWLLRRATGELSRSWRLFIYRLYTYTYIPLYTHIITLSPPAFSNHHIICLRYGSGHMGTCVEGLSENSLWGSALKETNLCPQWGHISLNWTPPASVTPCFIVQWYSQHNLIYCNT